jgi:hypothetical protein
MGEAPSPTITTVPFVLDGVAPLTAEMAPASMRLARAAMIVFFIGVFLLQAKSARLNNVPGRPSREFLCKGITI